MNERKLNMEIINAINDKLNRIGASFYYEPWKINSSVPGMQVKMKDTNNFISSSVINFTNEYFEWLNDYCKMTFDIELAYNNTGSICWAK